MIPLEVQAQRDFSGGQINASLKRRDDDPLIKTGGRQCLNWRPIHAATLDPRPGRRCLFAPTGARNEYIAITGGLECLLSFSAGRVTVYSLAGAVIFTSTSGSYLWTAQTLGQISWAQAYGDIVICYPGMRPQVVHWEQSTGVWSAAAFAFASANFAVQEPFYRFSALGARMTIGAQTGATTLACSVDYFTPAMVGAVISLLGQQVTITGYVDPQNVNVTVANKYPDSIFVTVADVSPFKAGQVAQLVTAGIKFEVQFISGNDVWGTLVNNINFVLVSGAGTSDVLVSPIGSSKTTFAGILGGIPGTFQWTEEFMSAVNGWPAACFFAHGRLGFCNFPQKPEAILWASIGLNNYCWVDPIAIQTTQTAGGTPDSAILEFMNGKPTVRSVVEWGDEFVFTSRGVYQIPVSANNPLAPGSVEFRRVSDDRCSSIRPVVTRETIVFVNEALSRISMVARTGSYTNPYSAQDLSDSYSDLFNGIVTVAVATGDAEHPERYAYVVNGDGSLVIGRETKGGLGWFPWKSLAPVTWVTMAGAAVLYSTRYGATSVLEVEDDAYWLDGLVLINAPASGMARGGSGPAWWFANGTVTLMDGLRDLGEHAVDGLGNIVPSAPGEDLSSATIVAGSFTPPVFEPFVPNAQSGPSQKQRMRLRKIAKASVSVQNSSGSLLVGDKLVPPYFFGEDAMLAPPLREDTYRNRPLGRSFDPRISISKTRPGPCRLVEVSLEVSV